MVAIYLEPPGSRCDARPEELCAAVRTVADGGGLLTPAVTRRVVAAAIADRLVIRPATARTYVSGLLAKTHARDRAQLVVLAYEAGLVRPGR